jgi:hypothetical protein
VRSVAHVLYQSLPFITAALRALGFAVNTAAEAALDPLPPVPGAVSAIVSSDPVLAEPAGRPLLLVPRGARCRVAAEATGGHFEAGVKGFC